MYVHRRQQRHDRSAGGIQASCCVMPFSLMEAGVFVGPGCRDNHYGTMGRPEPAEFLQDVKRWHGAAGGRGNRCLSESRWSRCLHGRQRRRHSRDAPPSVRVDGVPAREG
jgi:hypothetical protein